MNKQQIIDIIKGLLVAGGPVVVLLDVFGVETGAAERAVQALGALATVGGMIWLAMGRSGTNLAKDAATVPGVEVHVDTSDASAAPAALIDAALDRGVKDVVPMIGSRPDKK